MDTREIRENALITDWTKIPVEHVSKGIRRQMVVAGKVKFTVDGLAVIAAPGDVLHFPSNNRHGATMLDEEVVLIDIFSPIREDFLHVPVEVEPEVSTNGKG